MEATPIESTKKILLVVDDSPEVAFTARCCLQTRFERVFTTTSPKQAAYFLKTRPITHLLCDLELDSDGETTLSGLNYAAKWREDFPHLQRIIIYTGKDIGDITIPFCIDDIVPKMAGMDRIANALLGDANQD